MKFLNGGKDKEGENGELEWKDGEGRNEWTTRTKEWIRTEEWRTWREKRIMKGRMENLNGENDNKGGNGELEWRKG